MSNQNTTPTPETAQTTTVKGLDGANCSPRFDYEMWVDALSNVDHLSDQQLSRIGQIVSYRLRYRSTIHLAEMILYAIKQLQQELEFPVENS